MARRIIREQVCFGICIIHKDGSHGWLTDDRAEVALFPSEDEAAKFLQKRKRGNRYSWNVVCEIREFNEF